MRKNLSLGVLCEVVRSKNGNSWLLLTLRVGNGKQWETAMALKKTGRFDWEHLLAEMSYGKTASTGRVTLPIPCSSFNMAR